MGNDLTSSFNAADDAVAEVSILEREALFPFGTFTFLGGCALTDSLDAGVIHRASIVVVARAFHGLIDASGDWIAGVCGARVSVIAFHSTLRLAFPQNARSTEGTRIAGVAGGEAQFDYLAFAVNTTGLEAGVFQSFTGIGRAARVPRTLDVRILSHVCHVRAVRCGAGGC